MKTKCVEPVSLSLTAYAVHEYWKYNNEKRIHDRETELIRELTELLRDTKDKKGQEYIHKAIEELRSKETPPPTPNVFFEFWNFVTCGAFRR